jgi:hypothetical protein
VLILQPAFWTKVPADGKMIEAPLWVFWDSDTRAMRYAYFDPNNGEYLGDTIGPKFETLEAVQIG